MLHSKRLHFICKVIIRPDIGTRFKSIGKTGLSHVFLTLRNRLGKARIIFLIFILVYAFFLLLYLGSMSAIWDEIPHLNIGIMLLHGNFNSYLSQGPFYPPLYDLITAGFFGIGGVSLFNARLVSVVFAILTIWVVFEFVNSTSGSKVALLSALLLGVMPGFVLLSRLSMIETMLLFFVSLSLFFFYDWLRTNKNRYVIFSGIALGLAFLAKYPAVVAGLVMIVGVFIFGRDRLKMKLGFILLLFLIVAAFAVPWFLITFQIFRDQTLNQWLYVLTMGSPQKSAYDSQFPSPVFYLIAMTWPYGPYGFAPVSIFVYIFALVGLGLFAWKRKPEDKFLLAWFIIAYVFFTLIGNKDWRYMFVALPVLAIAAAKAMIFVYNKNGNYLKSVPSIAKKKIRGRFSRRLTAILVLTIILFSFGWNCADTTLWMIYKNRQSLPVEEATNYLSEILCQNESILVVGPFNELSKDIVSFYLQVNNRQNQVFQYPEQAVDTYQPNFNVDELVRLCEQNNVKYLFIYDNAPIFQFFNTTLTIGTIKISMNDSGRFTDEKSFGNSPYRIFLESFR